MAPCKIFTRLFDDAHWTHCARASGCLPFIHLPRSSGRLCLAAFTRLESAGASSALITPLNDSLKTASGLAPPDWKDSYGRFFLLSVSSTIDGPIWLELAAGSRHFTFTGSLIQFKRPHSLLAAGASGWLFVARKIASESPPRLGSLRFLTLTEVVTLPSSQYYY